MREGYWASALGRGRPAGDRGPTGKGPSPSVAVALVGPAGARRGSVRPFFLLSGRVGPPQDGDGPRGSEVKVAGEGSKVVSKGEPERVSLARLSQEGQPPRAPAWGGATSSPPPTPPCAAWVRPAASQNARMPESNALLPKS